MPQKTTEDPTLQAVRLLRESGYHEAAADLAVKALQRQAAAPNAADDPAETPVAPAAPPSSDDSARREGMQVLAAMRAQGILPAVEPTSTDSEPA